MKKMLIILLAAVSAILLALIILPYAFKDKAKEKLQAEINRNLNAEVHFSDVGISFFKGFPDVTLSVQDLDVKGTGAFANDTLVSLANLSFTIDLRSLISGNAYKIRQIVLNKPAFLFKVLADGRVNWDIMKQDTTPPPASQKTFKAYLDQITVNKGTLIYDDAELPMYIAFGGINGRCSGDMTNNNTTLDVEATCSSIDADYQSIRYLNHANAEVKTLLQADLSNWIFTFDRGLARLNEVEFTADGFFAMPDDGYRMNIDFKALENDFKSFLSFIPAVYSKQFDALKSGGTMQLSGNIKGLYSDDSIPSFNIGLKVRNGWFGYPGLPGKVTGVNLSASIVNPASTSDSILINVDTLRMAIMQNALEAVLRISTPVSDPNINAKLNGKINLSDIAKVYPLEASTKLSGAINADMAFAGRLSAIESGAYDRFKASGLANANGVVVQSMSLPQNLNISTARLDFTPKYVKLQNLVAMLGKNDLSASGQIENYIPFVLKNKAVLKGELTTTSQMMDLNSILQTGKSTGKPADSSQFTTVEVPSNIDFRIKSIFGKLVYGKYDLSNVQGVIAVKNQSLVLENLQMNTLGGKIALNGSYSTTNPLKPVADLSLEMKDLDLKQSFGTLVAMQQFAPITEKMSGAFSTKFKFRGDLNQNMVPDFATISAYGLLLSDALRMHGVNTLSKISDALQLEKLRTPAVEKVNLSFDLLAGKAKVNKTTFKLAGYAAELSGIIGLDQSMNFTLNMQIPKSEFGAKANSVLTKMVSEASKKGIDVKVGDLIPVTVLIGGTVTNPKITTGIKSAMAEVAADLEKQALEQIEKKKEEMLIQAKTEASVLITKAAEEADKLILEVEMQSKKLLDAAQISSDKVKYVTDSTANYILAEGKKNGIAAELVAKKAAEKTRKEGYTKADKIMADAKTKSDELLTKARAEADKLRLDALEKVK